MFSLLEFFYLFVGEFGEFLFPSFGGFELGSEGGWECDGVVLADVAAHLEGPEVAVEGAEGAEGDGFATVDGLTDFLDGEGEDEVHCVGGDACLVGNFLC